MDNCCAHSISEEITSICIYYLPKNTTYFLQPLDQGIIRNFKANYQLNLNEKVVSIIDSNVDEEEFIANFIRKINVLDALHMINEAWNKIEISAIKNTFEKAGISNLKISENDSILNEDFDSNTLEEEEKSENYHTREPDTINIIDLISELHKTNENISKRDCDFTDENEDQAQRISFQL